MAEENRPNQAVKLEDLNIIKDYIDSNRVFKKVEHDTAVESSLVTLYPNHTTVIGLVGSCTIELAEGLDNRDNEWCFEITQGDVKYEVTLPEGINWGFGAVPLFDANTTTYCMLYYIGDKLCGEWRAV